MKGFGHKSVVMIGDGVTDMQAKPPAALFIGFGGVVVREKVRDGADWFISDFSVSFYLILYLFYVCMNVHTQTRRKVRTYCNSSMNIRPLFDHLIVFRASHLMWCPKLGCQKVMYLCFISYSSYETSIVVLVSVSMDICVVLLYKKNILISLFWFVVIIYRN